MAPLPANQRSAGALSPALFLDTDSFTTVHYDEDGDFPKFFNSLKEHERAAVILTIEKILTPLGINICQTEWENRWVRAFTKLELDIP